MAEYSMDDVFEDVTLTIGEHRFKLKERTHSLGAKVDPVRKKLGEIDDEAPDQEFADLLVELIDMVLAPLGDGNGTRSHAKTILAKSYKNEEIGLDRLNALAEWLNDKMSDRSRPTSAVQSGG